MREKLLRLAAFVAIGIVAGVLAGGLAGWVVAQASFVLLFLSVIRIAEPERIPTGGQAYVAPQPGGVLLGFEVAP